MMRTVPCKSCGARLLTHEGDDPDRPVRCADCWRKTPEDVIIRESREYDERRKQTRKEIGR